MDRRDYDSPYSRSPDIEILPDDEVDLTLTPPDHPDLKAETRRRSFDRDENEESLHIKPPPPQSNPSKRDKHKHKHKDDRKRDRDREKDRSRHGDRERDRGSKHRDRHDKERSDAYDARVAREKEKERDRERQRRKDFEENEAELKRREKSQQERDRLERLERERRKLEREAEREQREREHREKMRQEQERIAKAEREQERLEKAEREQRRYIKSEREKDRMLKSSRSDANRSHRREETDVKKPHSTRQDVEKRRDRDREKDRRRDKRTRERSRSRSPHDHRESRRRNKDYYSPPHDRHSYKPMHEEELLINPEDHEHVNQDHNEIEDDLLEDMYEKQAKSTIQSAEEELMEEASSESSSESDSEDSDTDSDSDSDESMPSHKSATHSESEGSAVEPEHDDLQHARLRSKFDDDGPASEVESLPESEPHEAPTDEEDYLDQTPPESPLELAPELPLYLPAIQGCRNVEEFHCLNRIEEGTYGVVYRARDNKTNELVALKRLKMEKEKEGFPITSLREINTLLKAQHPNIVTVREIVVGSNMDKIYIVMDYVEHDLKSLMQSMKDPFIIGEVKTLMQQLLRGVAHLHDNWIIHRDLKTSNLLLSHSGILKIGDFGLAREYGSPLKPYTSVVVTLWYRSPELLLGIKEYSTYIDMWSVGCIFAEFLTMKPLFPGKSEIDQLNRVFKELGTPNEKIWPGVSQLPVMKKCTFAEYPYNQLRKRFSAMLTDKGFDLMNRFLTYDPVKRITAKEALQHQYFVESPIPVPPSMFPTWPAKSEQSSRTHGNTPRPPSGGKAYDKLLGDDDDEVMERGFRIGGNARGATASTGFALKF